MRTKNILSVRLLSVLLTLCLLAGFSGVATVPAYAATTAVTTPSVDYTTYNYSDAVEGLTITYYDDIDSRGFCWFTAKSEANNASELYVVEGNQGSNATFTNESKINGTCVEETYGSVTYYSHKAHVTDLTAGKTYSYKVGQNGNYKYGTFTVESSSISSIDILTFTDAQTKNLSLLSTWENTVAQGMSTLSNPDFILYDGDQFDVSGQVNSSKVLAYGVALDTISDLIGSTPYMASLGNHDYNVTNLRSDIDTADSANSGYYSFDYGFAHFVVVNSNGNSSNTSSIIDKEATWLDADLKAAKNNSNIKWIIVMMHNGPASTGDHSLDSITTTITEKLSEIISENHVDLVIQGHDHTYSKTLPYKWDTVGRTTTYGNTDIVNYNVATITSDGITYDLNPNGTYYVTTGASGHRAGPTAGETAQHANVTVNANASDGSGLSAKSSSETYLNNTYKTIVGTCNVGCTTGTTTVNKGDPATCNIDGQMFGTLSLTEDTLKYTFYTVSGSTVQVLDTLNILKSDSDVAEYTGSVSSANDESSIMDLLTQLWEDSGLAKLLSADTWNALRDKVASIITSIETSIKSALASLNSGSSADSELVAVQSSVTDGTFAARFIGGTDKTEEELEEYEKIGFEISADSGSGFTETKTVYCKEIYTSSVLNDGTYEITNSISASDGQNLFALTVSGISTDGTVIFKIKPFMIDEDGNTNYGAERTVTFEYGFYKSVE